ncbi:thioesterase II family protein [Streptomyces sp. NPDC001037]|uniref:thioesterase II family protein n=1 Tax=Streptomyces sp. NPDC001037 TaxID=3364542 RepID=UPI0036B89E10
MSVLSSHTLSTADWIRRYRPRPDAAVRLVCFPHAGGSAPAFLPWADAFGPAVEVLAVQYPGRQERHAEPLVPDLHRLADLVTPAVRAAVGDAPYALFGHSMGASLAFEVALRLERSGSYPALLAVSGRRAPSIPADPGRSVHHLDDVELITHLKDLSGTDPRLLDDPEARAMILPVVRADLRAVETHGASRETRVSAPILALTGDADPWTPIDEAAEWNAHTSGPFELRVFPGGHFFLTDLREEVVALVDERISAGSARV